MKFGDYKKSKLSSPVPSPVPLDHPTNPIIFRSGNGQVILTNVGSLRKYRRLTQTIIFNYASKFLIISVVEAKAPKAQRPFRS